MAKPTTLVSKSDPATLIKVGTVLRQEAGDTVVKEIAIAQQQDTGEWKTLLFIDLCLEDTPDSPLEQVYLDELIRSMKRKTIVPIDAPKPSKKKV